jgi:hypothetical protein
MERLSDDAQWIIMIAFLVSIAMFFLALVINQSTLVGQTTAEGVLEFPKNDIQDLRSEIFAISAMLPPTDPTGSTLLDAMTEDIAALSLARKNSVVEFTMVEKREVSGVMRRPITIYYNNGVTTFDETISY